MDSSRGSHNDVNAALELLNVIFDGSTANTCVHLYSSVLANAFDNLKYLKG